MRTLEKRWIEYRDACYPPKNGPMNKIQETETRQAFFAGCLVVLKHAVESSADMPEEQAMTYIGNLIKEAQEVCSQRVYEMKERN